MITSDGTWITVTENDVGVRTSTDHYREFRYKHHQLRDGGSMDVATRAVKWGPDGFSKITSRRRITNDAALREFLSNSELVAQNDGIWLGDVPESVCPKLD